MDRPFYDRHCGKKQAHDTKRKAKHVIRKMRSRGKNVVGLRAYECQFCGRWHIGHKPRKKNDASKSNGGGKAGGRADAERALDGANVQDTDGFLATSIN